MIDPSPGKRSWRGLDILVVSPTPTHPQDHGNRKRIFEVCSALKRQGANIHFVHYPAEHDWRSAWPVRHENAMRAEWSSYHLVPPSRDLHAAAAGADHAVDEWADPSLQAYIGWISSRRPYDAIIVNYTWMSFCLRAAPDDVFKILDTHDVFAGRREMLEANGVGAEFFHTTKSEEAKGVARAHLVWAIKPAEQSYFENELGVENCLTLLHSEPEQDWWRKPPSSDGWLRAGAIGARNNVNRRNLEAFLDKALPIFERYWAPVKIVIAGGCSDDFKTFEHPNVEVLGRVESVEAFYRSIDVAIAPMEFSTGLKIKISEALTSGTPLVAHAHAMEGYPTRERLHLLTSFESMATELSTLSFDRAPLLALAAKSRAISAEVRASVTATLAATHAKFLAFSGEALLIIVPTEAFEQKSLLNDHFSEAADYLRFAGRIAIYIVGPARKGLKFDILQRSGLARRQFVDPELMKELGDEAPETFAPIEFGELLETRGYQSAYFMTGEAALLRAGTGGLRDVYVRQDAVELAGGDPGSLIDALRPKCNVVVIDNLPPRASRWRDRPGVTGTLSVPFRRNGVFASFALRAKSAMKPTFLLLLAEGDDLIGEEILALVNRLGRTAKRLGTRDPGFANAIQGRLAPGKPDPLADFTELRLVVDLLGQNSHSAILREAAQRLGIPWFSVPRGALARAGLAFPDPLRPSSGGELMRRIADAALVRGADAELRERTRGLSAALFSSDAGWAALWKMLMQPNGGVGSGPPDAAAALLG